MASNKEKLGIMYFRRDLRLTDNTALNKCIEENDRILLLFIFNPIQIDDSINKYYGERSFSLLQHFLQELNEECKDKIGVEISIFKGDPTKVLDDTIKKLNKLNGVGKISIYFNTDYTPFSIQRDTDIFMNCSEVATVKAYCDHLLTDTRTITEYQQLYQTNPNDIYKKFTPFYNYYSSIPPSQPHTASVKKIIPQSLKVPEYKMAISNYPEYKNMNRKNALKALSQNIDYHHTHDSPYNEDGTFNISHYLKFGVISIREAYYELQKLTNKNARDAVIRQLYWRDFYTLIAWAYPKLLGWNFGGFNSKRHPVWTKLKENSALYDKYNEIKWNYDKKIIKAWQDGKTGFPIVDAGMRQLLQTGYMHNRVRLITASFLTKICGIDWRVGELWFAKHLIDYDPIINNGNWLWVAGGGADSQPYFRVFNPWIQQIKHDPDCVYIKRWIPELKAVDNKIIHKYYLVAEVDSDKKLKGCIIPKDYAVPVIDYAIEKEKTYVLYKNAVK